MNEKETNPRPLEDVSKKSLKENPNIAGYIIKNLFSRNTQN